MANKVTKREVLEHIIDTYATDTMVVEYATHEIELLDKKNASRGESKTTKENNDLRAKLVEFLSNVDKELSIYEITQNCELFANASNQKMSALLKPLVDNGQVVKTIKKKMDKLD